MSLPPALLQRLAQRGLVQKQKRGKIPNEAQAENEEVIAEDYDEMENVQPHDTEEEYQYPPLYDNETTVRKRDDSFWLERMRTRMGDSNSYGGYKACPNKYNIYHKCSLYCVTRWEDGHTEPSRDYMRRFKRMVRKYPLPKGWTEIYDAGCGVYYFANEADGVVSWLSPTHPKSVITKSAAILRKQLDENNGEERDSDDEDEEDEESSDTDERSTRKSSRRSKSPPPKLSAQDFPSLHDSLNASPTTVRKQKSHDAEKNLPRQRRERERERRGRDRYVGGRGREDSEALDPMDPSAYSDIPRGKWSDGLQTSSEKSKKSEPERREKQVEEESENSE